MVYQSKEKIKYICIINVAGKNGAIYELQNLLDNIIYNKSPLKNINIDKEFKFVFREITESVYDNEYELLKLCQKQEIYDQTETSIEYYGKRKIEIKKCDFNQVKKENFKNFKIIINVDYSPNMKSEDFSGKFEEMCDPLFMQYLLLLVQKLENNKFKYLVLVRDSSSEEQKRKNAHYFQIRHSLRIYHEKFSEIIDCFFYDDGDGIKHIYRKKKEEHFGRIFPFIPLTIDIYGDLVRIKDNDGESVKILEDVYDDFLADFKDSKKEQIIESECRSDNLLTKFLFIYTLHYMQDSNEWKSVEKKLHIIHEVCADYAEGIQQLIENAIMHSIRKSSEGSQGGCGVFTLRIRKKEDSKYLSDDVKNENVFKDTQFFMELYVTDLSYNGGDGYKGIVEKFKENVKYRDEKEEYKDKFKDLELAQLFGDKKSDDLDNYYNNAKNIAFHFGLQILANTVEQSKGYMFVRSGNEDKSLCVYENEIFLEKKKVYKVSNNFKWHDGTAYIIYLPIALREEISNVDIPAVEINNDTNTVQGDENIVYLFNDLSISDEVLEEIRKIVKQDKKPKKEKLVEILIRILSIKECEAGEILVIDCSRLDEIIKVAIKKAGNKVSEDEVGEKLKDILNQLSQYNLYEILAKAIFRFIAGIAEKKEQKMTIAVINVGDRYKVIHLLRQFMLFYRRGKSGNMKGHSIFIVDKEAELDVLLYDSIDKMAESMYTSQLTGGLDGRAMEIIRYFAKTRNQQGEK